MLHTSVVAGLVAKELIPWSSVWTYVMFGGLLLMIIMGTWAGAVAGRNGRSPQSWFLIGFLIPFVGLIVCYAVGAKKDTGQQGKAKPGAKTDLKADADK
jgi:hypothetical protein